MGDPVITPQLLAAAGAGIGALSKPRNPLQGALLGGIAGYSGGTALGLGAPAATTTAASAAAPVTSATNTALANQIAFNPAASYGGGNILNAANAANTANVANFNALNSAGMSFGGRSPIDPTMLNTTGVTNAAPSFAEKIGMAGKSAYENPMMTAQALSATNSLLQPEQMPSAPTMPLQAGRGVKPFDFVAAMDPYRPSVVGGNQQISLLG
jgi:hypothetical protein